ncbi:hypothetical protein [Ktedonobacter racemifer]|uniref:Transposase n=1 Tax=Ktedonobacter racemifer DSM 44963 TaxID=485913 RepID=D6TXB5_KTERA|nr:hypothetical protein [Ktedonobacter racemifer]EFH84848.1 hypothetical protein Krac_5963 [Ktedonobacter racemifer DSM 44963]
MQIIYERCAAIDVHQKTAVTTVLITQANGHQQKQTRTFATTTSDLLLLDDWLHELGVTVVAMESTGVFTPPPMLPIGVDTASRGCRRHRTHTKNDADLLLID